MLYFQMMFSFFLIFEVKPHMSFLLRTHLSTTYSNFLYRNYNNYLLRIRHLLLNLPCTVTEYLQKSLLIRDRRNCIQDVDDTETKLHLKWGYKNTLFTLQFACKENPQLVQLQTWSRLRFPTMTLMSNRLSLCFSIKE